MNDLANLIIDEIQQNVSKKSLCDLYFSVNGEEYSFSMYIGKSNHVIFIFNKMEFKCKDKEIYSYLLKYFIEYIFNESNNNTAHKIEYDNYDPYYDDNYDKLVVNVKSKSLLVFTHFFEKMISEDVHDALLPLYYMYIDI